MKSNRDGHSNGKAATLEAILEGAEVIPLKSLSLAPELQKRLDAAYTRLEDAAGHVNRISKALADAQREVVRADGRFDEALEWCGHDTKLGKWRWDGEHVHLEVPGPPSPA